MFDQARNIFRKFIYDRFFVYLTERTKNFSSIKWLGKTCYQNLFDLWVIQETICELKPDLIIETGTYRGGSALFYASLFDLLGKGRVVTIDVKDMIDFQHPRLTFIMGDSVSADVIEKVADQIDDTKDKCIWVILDSDHSRKHVLREIEVYKKFVTKGSYILVQDGVIDKLSIFSNDRPGPLKAIEQFMRDKSEFVIDTEKTTKFPLTHHPCGWLKRI